MIIIKKLKRIVKRILRFANNYKIRRSDRLIDKIVTLKLTYLSKNALSLLRTSVKYVEQEKIEGDIIETGCALGGSSILIAKSKNKSRKFRIFDSFEMMPEPSYKDGEEVRERFDVIKSGSSKGIKGDLYYGYEKELLKKVKRNFKTFNIDLRKEHIDIVKGYYEDTLVVNAPIALAHIDCDWYDSVMVSLQRITPHLSIGGILIIDDYHRYDGCKKATDTYFFDKKDQFKFVEKERLVIEKIR